MSADREPTAVEVLDSHRLTTPVQCVCGWRETDGDAGTHPQHALAALKAAGFVVATRRQIRVREGDAWDNALTEMRDLGWMHDGALVDGLARNPYRDVQP